MWVLCTSQPLSSLSFPMASWAAGLVVAFFGVRLAASLMYGVESLEVGIAAAAVAYHNGSDALDLLLWIIVLLVQSVPYLAALLVAVLSAFPKLIRSQNGGSFENI